MIKADLCRFMDRVIEERSIGQDDLNRLQQTILGSGITSREEVEALLALGRSLDGDPRWREVLTALIVDFVVWSSQPRGIVTAEASRWLASALDAADQPDTALYIAYAVVEEAHAVDEALLTFILRGRQRPPQGLAARPSQLVIRRRFPSAPRCINGRRQRPPSEASSAFEGPCSTRS